MRFCGPKTDLSFSLASSSDHARLNEELTQARETIAQLEKEYAEFEKESRELEEHLESEVSRLEDELEAANKKLKIAKSELQDSKEKQIDTERGMQTTIQSLEQELEQERAKSAKLASRLVSMEQENEDLERVHRELEADFGKSQSTMDNALEENAVIQTDLEELRNLSRETIQRLTDELRGTKKRSSFLLSSRNNHIYETKIRRLELTNFFVLIVACLVCEYAPQNSWKRTQDFKDTLKTECPIPRLECHHHPT